MATVPTPPAKPTRPELKVPPLPWATRKALAGQWPDVEKSGDAVVAYLPVWVNDGLAWVTAWVTELLDEKAPAVIEGQMPKVQATLDKGWTAAKAWVRGYLEMKPAKPAK